eukprot:11412817-Alexandrium_andersonii.AAC.1
MVKQVSSPTWAARKWRGTFARQLGRTWCCPLMTFLPSGSSASFLRRRCAGKERRGKLGGRRNN